MQKIKLIVAVTLAASVAITPLIAQTAGSLRTRVKPGVAGVFVDSKYQGTAKKIQSSPLRLSAGEHEVKLVEPRYKPVTVKVNVTSGQTEKVRQTMERIPPARPPFGLFKIKGGERAALYINTHYYGQADEFNGPGQGLKLNPGSYEVKIVPLAGGAAKEETITIEKGKTSVVRMP